MTKNLEIIEHNAQAQKPSFLYYFHERNEFNKAAMLQLIQAITECTLQYLNRPLDKQLSKKINAIHVYILKKLPEYLYENFTSEYENSEFLEHYKYMERLEYAVNAYFLGIVFEDKGFEPLDENAKL